MNFPIEQVPLPGRPQPLQQPQHYDPAGIIMQAAQMRQQRDQFNQQMQQKNVSEMTQSLQSMASLQEEKRRADMSNTIAQQNLDIARGRLPLEAAETRLKNIQADQLAGSGGPFYNADQAATVIGGVGATPDAVSQAKDMITKVYPNGVIPKDRVHEMAVAARFSQTQGTKVSEFDENKWQKMNEDGNPMLKGSRYPIGQIAISNMALNQIRSVLSNPNTSDQELSMALGKLNTVMNGGSIDEQNSKSKLYGTMQSRYNKVIQNLTATPQLAQQPQVVGQIMNITNELQAANSSYADSYFNGIRSAYAPTIAKDPSRYMNMESSWRQAVAPTQQPGQQQAQAAAPPQQGMLGSLLNAAGMSKPAQQARPGKVRVKDPNGIVGWVPQEELHGAMSNGYQQY